MDRKTGPRADAEEEERHQPTVFAGHLRRRNTQSRIVIVAKAKQQKTRSFDRAR
jgi:hypothetical protein